MLVFIIRRTMQSAVVVLFMSMIVFFGINVVGDPIDALINPEADQEDMEKAIKALGLDKPIWEQYLVFLKGVAQGSWGRSFIFGTPALKLIVERIPATFELAMFSMLIAVLLGIPLGVIAGLLHDRVIGRSIMGFSILGFSLPSFWVGLMLILIFAVQLGWLPATGRGSTQLLFGIPVSFLSWDGLRHLLLPAINLALFKFALVIRLARAGTKEVMHQDYIKFARAKGLSNRRVVLVHVMKNMLIPVVTVLGLELGAVIAFAVVTETIFAWPGIGKLLIDSIQILDRPVVVAYLIITVLMFIFINLVVDIIYSILDPRVRLQET